MIRNKIASYIDILRNANLGGVLREAADAGIEALERVRIPPNEPLTLEQLREMDGEPVWVVSIDGEWASGWYVLASHSRYGFIPKGRGFLAADDFGKTWLAYRRPPEGEI